MHANQITAANAGWRDQLCFADHVLRPGVADFRRYPFRSPCVLTDEKGSGGTTPLSLNKKFSSICIPGSRPWRSEFTPSALRELQGQATEAEPPPVAAERPQVAVPGFPEQVAEVREPI